MAILVCNFHLVSVCSCISNTLQCFFCDRKVICLTSKYRNVKLSLGKIAPQLLVLWKVTLDNNISYHSLIYLVCHLKTNTIWAMLFELCSLSQCSVFVPVWNSTIKTTHRQKLPYDLAGASLNLVHPLIDSDDISWLGGILFSVLCLKLDLSLCPSPIKCLNIFLDASCQLWILTLDILCLCRFPHCPIFEYVRLDTVAHIG